MPDYTVMRIDRETYENIRTLAKASGRTIMGQVAFMVRMWNRDYRVVNITPLPGVADVVTVPLVEVMALEGEHENP